MGRAKTSTENQGRPLGVNGQQVRAPRGVTLNCHGWRQEGALRMLMNSLDPDVAEQPGDLVACGTTGRVLHDWESYEAATRALKALKNNETLLIQSGSPVGVFKTEQEAARVIITSTGPTGRGAAADKPDQLDQRRLPMLAGTDPASWTYTGTQEALPTAFHALDAIARIHFGGNLGGKLIVSGGMGAAGGALPLAAGMLGGSFLGIEVDGERIRRRIRAGYCDYCVNTLDEALRILKNAVRQKQSVSVGLVGNCADVMPELADRGVLPDILTDQTSAHDLLHGYIPSSLDAVHASMLRRESPDQYRTRSCESLARHFNAMLALKKLGSITFEFGNNLCAKAQECGVAGAATAFPNFAEDYLPLLREEGMSLIRWVALSGEPGDIRQLDDVALELFPDDPLLARWIPLARKYMRFQGLPARVCWMDQQTRILLADRVNKLVANGVFKAPMVIVLSHAGGNERASRNYEAERQEHSFEVISNRRLMNSLQNSTSGASWVSLKAGAGYSHATVVLVADGTPETANALPRVIKKDYAREIMGRAAAVLE